MANQRINLIPPELRPSLKSELKALPHEVIPVVLAVVALFFMGSEALSIRKTTQKSQAELAGLKSQQAELQVSLDTLMRVTKAQEMETEKIKFFQEILSKKSYWSEIFKELGVIMPPKVWLTSLQSSGEFPNKKLILKGESISQQRVAGLLADLDKSQHFAGAMMNSSVQVPKVHPHLYRFEFTVPFPEPGSKGDS